MDYLLLSCALSQWIDPLILLLATTSPAPRRPPTTRWRLFMRRRFGDDNLYKAIFTSYLRLMLEKGHAEYFIEGARSRTGRMRVPREECLA